MEELLAKLNISLQEFIALIVAFGALFFTGWQLFAQRRHNKLSVKPLLFFEHKWADGVRKVFLKNVGLGPAIICSHTLKYKERLIPFEIRYHIEEMADDILGGGFYSGGYALEKDQVIDKGESINILALYWHEQHDYHEAKEKILNFLELTEFTIEYKSMYEQKQKLTKNLVSPDDYSI